MIIEPKLRKATMKKGKKFPALLSLKKGQEVLIETTIKYNGFCSYRAFEPVNTNVGFEVKASDFEFSEDETYVIGICRTSYSHATFEVKAKTRKEAEHIANEQAGDHLFSESDATYSTTSVRTKEEFEKLKEG